jgi:hypothetical protein
MRSEGTARLPAGHARHAVALLLVRLMVYVDEHDRQRTQSTLADLVAGTLTVPD